MTSHIAISIQCFSTSGPPNYSNVFLNCKVHKNQKTTLYNIYKNIKEVNFKPIMVPNETIIDKKWICSSTMLVELRTTGLIVIIVKKSLKNSFLDLS
jgi:hypothetical protein